jgi:hypothetical protein
VLFDWLIEVAEHRLMINDDIEAIIKRGEERTSELNSKYEGLNLEDLSNFKSEASVQQWEGEDFRSGVRLSLPYQFFSETDSFLCPATQSNQLQPAGIVETRTQVELLGR